MVELVAGVVLVAGGAVLALANWAILVETHRTKKHLSMVGPLGGLAMLAGSALLGWRWGMLLALADPGVLMVMYLPVFLVIEARRSRRRKRRLDGCSAGLGRASPARLRVRGAPTSCRLCPRDPRAGS